MYLIAFLFICFLFMTLSIYHHLKRELICPLSQPKTLDLDSLGTPLSLPYRNNRVTAGYFRIAEVESNELIVLVHDHWQSPDQMTILADYFHHKGMHVLTYQQRNQNPRQRPACGFGHIDFEGADLRALLTQVQTRLAKKELTLHGFGIGFGATALLQLENRDHIFTSLILEHLTPDFDHWLHLKTTQLLSSFFWRNWCAQLLKFNLRWRYNLQTVELTNLVPCSIPILLIHSDNHPTIRAFDRYQFQPFFTNLTTFTCKSNDLDAAIFAETHRFLFILDTFFDQR